MAIKRTVIILIAYCFFHTGFAQGKYFTRVGTVSFQASTDMEEVEGVNKTALAIFDSATGQLEFALLIKGFEFKNALMQDHFNENYMESSKYPKALFKGQILHIDSIQFKKTGFYPVTVTGTLQLHGVTKDIEMPCMFRVLNDETLTSELELSIELRDYKISVPRIVKDKIAPTVKIQVYCSYEVLIVPPPTQ